MASFTETATLAVADNSSVQIKAINSALKSLFKTVSKIQSKTAEIDIKTKGLAQATTMVKNLAHDLNSLKGHTINFKANTGAITQASRQITQMRQQASRPIHLGFVGGALVNRGMTAAGHAIKEGTRELDIGETSLALKEIPEGTRKKFIEEQIRKISKDQQSRAGGSMFNRGAIEQQYSEMLGVTKIGAATSDEDFRKRADAAAYLADQNLELAQTFVKLGMDQKHAAETSAKFGKAMEQQGKIFDQAGNLDKGVAAQEYDNIRKLIPTIGKEATGENYLALMKYLRTSKFSLEPEAVASAMFKFEEMGTGAAVGINQMIKNISGGAKPKQLNELARLGILPSEDKWVGKGKRRKLKQVAGELSEEDSDLLRKSPQRFVNEKVVPRLEADLRRQGKTEAQIQTMLNDAQKSGYVARQTQKMASERTAQEMLASMILLRKENEQALADYRSRSGTVESQREATKMSVIGATAAISSQAQGVAGELARAVAPVLVPTLGAISAGMRDFGDTIHRAQGTGPDAEAAQASIAKGALLTFLAAPFAKMGLDVGKGLTRPITQAIDKVASPLGTVSAIEGMTSKDPAVRSLSSAGWLLQTAAKDLTNAAVLLGAEKAGETLLDHVGDVFKKGGKMLPFLGRAATVLGTAAAVVGGGVAAYQYYQWQKDKSPGSISPEGMAEVARSSIQAELDAAKRAYATTPNATEKSELGAKIEELSGRIAKISDDLSYMGGEQAPPWVKDPNAYKPTDSSSIPNWGDPKAISDAVAAALKNSKNWYPNIREVPDGEPKPGEIPTPVPGSSIEDFKKAAELTDQSAGKMTTAVTNVGTASTNFATAFDTGATKLATAGKTAVSDMEGGAGKVGALIAAAFVAGASGVKVGVDTSGIVQAGYKSPANKGNLPVSI